MLRKSTDDFMDVAMMPKGGEGDEDASTATSLPPIKEVNNNVLGSSACVGAEVAASPEASTASNEVAKAEAAATVYSCGSLRVSVTAAVTPSAAAAAQWLCVARLPGDFTRAELLELVEEYGAVEETHMIHSEKTGEQI